MYAYVCIGVVLKTLYSRSNQFFCFCVILRIIPQFLRFKAINFKESILNNKIHSIGSKDIDFTARMFIQYFATKVIS